MTPNHKYGRTEIAPVTNLPQLAIDMAEGEPLASTLGKTEVPVHFIQGPTLDFGLSVPALHLRLTLRPGATPREVALDLFRLHAAVNQYDLTQQGAGLLPGDGF